MKKQLIMGNAAAAYGALAAGVNLISGYPGTPSSEVLETAAVFVRDGVAAGRIAAADAPHIEWSVNEKAALELAFGASLSGARALVTMKQVGLNVAADPLMTISYLGVKGGLVLFVADDPGPISSQNEQDTRQFAQFAKVPLLDAASPEELYEVVQQAFELSEQHAVPVIVRATTRVCHGSAPLAVSSTYVPHKVEGFVRSPQWVIFPPLAYRAHAAMPERFRALLADASFAARNYLVPAADAKAALAGVGVVAGGISWCYLLDALEQVGISDSIDLFKVGAPFPFDDELAAGFLAAHKHVLVLEELEPTLERELLRVAGSRQLCANIQGKLTGLTAYAGENSIERITADLLSFLESIRGSVSLPERVQHALDNFAGVNKESVSLASEGQAELLLPRPPVLCAGCPHRASFYAVKKALRGKKATFSGDIGCYTLGNAQPLDMVDTCVCMGAGFTVPQGMFWAEPEVHHLGFVGDSTFFASGITGVVNAVYNRVKMTLIVLDNSLTAMTGAQPHPGTGERMSFDAAASDAADSLSIPRILTALGVSSVCEVDPLDTPRAVQAVREALAAPGVSAIVFKAPCINVATPLAPPTLLADVCTGCHVCIKSLGCPALTMRETDEIITVAEDLCFGCDLCVRVCPHSALRSAHD